MEVKKFKPIEERGAFTFLESVIMTKLHYSQTYNKGGRGMLYTWENWLLCFPDWDISKEQTEEIILRLVQCRYFIVHPGNLIESTLRCFSHYQDVDEGFREMAPHIPTGWEYDDPSEHLVFGFPDPINQTLEYTDMTGKGIIEIEKAEGFE